jgi:hypothetical protein
MESITWKGSLKMNPAGENVERDHSTGVVLVGVVCVRGFIQAPHCADSLVSSRVRLSSFPEESIHLKHWNCLLPSSPPVWTRQMLLSA